MGRVLDFKHVHEWDANDACWCTITRSDYLRALRQLAGYQDDKLGDDGSPTMVPAHEE